MPDPEDPTPEAAQDRDTRTDAAGFDVTPPPGTRDIGNKSHGLSDGPPPDREGWREFDATAEWKGDAPYPAEADEPETDADLPDQAASGDVVEQVATLLEQDADTLIDDLSVEKRGATIVLRGIAASQADRARAEDLALSVPGVETVDNQLGADAEDRP